MCKYRYSVDMAVPNSTTGVLERVRPGSRVLEFGTATGYMSRFMRETLGCRVTGLEIDEGAAALASRWTDRMVVASLDAPGWLEQVGPGPYDHVLFVDVLEHLVDPWGVLDAARTLLAPGGTMLLSIPNVGHNSMLLELLAGEFQYRSTGLLDSTHVRFFTWTSVLQLLAHASLNPIEATAVVLPPELTEFGRTYADVPPAVAEYLMARPQGHAYQFIVKAQAIGDEPGAELQPVTIVMVLDDQAAEAGRVLDAIRATTGDARFTVLLVEDGTGGAGGAVPDTLGEDVRVIRNAERAGFAAAAATAIAEAPAGHVVLLAPGVHLQPGWLDALLTTGAGEGVQVPVLVEGAALSGPRDVLAQLSIEGGTAGEALTAAGLGSPDADAVRVADDDVASVLRPEA